jgi:hypothetical protein
MKRNKNSSYSYISSFEDFRREKEILILKEKIIEARLSLTYLQISQVFSVSNLVFSLVKKYIIPALSKLKRDMPENEGKEDTSQ